MRFPCPSRIVCVGSDDPIANLSSEGYDPLLYIAPFYPPNWRGECCLQFCESAVSQEEADLCAYNMSVQADLAGCSPTLQPDGSFECGPATGIFWNTEQCCSATCENFQQFFACTPANTVSASSQIEADRIAMSLACQAAEAKKFCLDPIILGCCLNKPYLQLITITGGTAPFSWSITSGFLPAGLVLSAVTPDHRQMEIAGIPTIAGLVPVTVEVTDAAGGVNTSVLQVGVVDFLPVSLPDATVGTPYSADVSTPGSPPGGTVQYEVTSGSLPTGLTLSLDGKIRGTPTGGLPATFTITAVFA